MEEEIKMLEQYIDVDDGALKIWQIDELNKCEDLRQAISNLLTRYKQLEEENKNCKKEYHCLVNKIENKIDKFDYQFEKAKRKNDKDRADYYWDLIGNFIKLLREE